MLLAYLGTGIAIWKEQTWLLATSCLGVLLFAAVAGEGPGSRARRFIEQPLLK